MAAIDEGLRSLLIGETSVTDLLATTGSVFVDAITQDYELDYISLTVLNQDPMKYLDSTSGMRTSNIDIDCVATTRVKSSALADAVDAFIKDYSGAAGSNTINAVLLEALSYDAVPVQQGSDNYKYITTLNVDIQHDA